MPVREFRVWTLILLGTALVVGVPLSVWRALVDEEVGEAAQVFVSGFDDSSPVFVGIVAASGLLPRMQRLRARP